MRIGGIFIGHSNDQGDPISVYQKMLEYLETQLVNAQALATYDRLIFSELAKIMGDVRFSFLDIKKCEVFRNMVNSVTELATKLHCLEGSVVLGIIKRVLKYLTTSKNRTSSTWQKCIAVSEKLRKNLGDLAEEMGVLYPEDLAKLYIDARTGDTKAILYETAPASRDKAFTSILNNTECADQRCSKVIGTLRKINDKRLSISDCVYEALDSFISEPRESAEKWVKASRDAIFLFLKRDGTRVYALSHRKQLHEVIIKFLKALRKLDCTECTELVKKVVATVTKDVIELAEDKVFSLSVTDEHIILVMDLFAKYGTWFTKSFSALYTGVLYTSAGKPKSLQASFWLINTHPLLRCIGLREIYKLRQNYSVTPELAVDFQRASKKAHGLSIIIEQQKEGLTSSRQNRELSKFLNFGSDKIMNTEISLHWVNSLRAKSDPSEYLVELSEVFLSVRFDTKFGPSLCNIVEPRETDPPELLLRLFLCLVRYLQGSQTEHLREEQSPNKGTITGTVKILGEEGAPGVEVVEQDLSSPILKSMLVSSFEESRTRTITVPSAPQRILEALKLILCEGGKGVEEHATLKDVWEWLLPWATMYQVDGVFKYLVMVMNAKSDEGSTMSDEWMVEFAIRSKHPAWLMLISNRFLLIETLNLPVQDLTFAITELTNAAKDRENYLVNIISYFCTQQCSDLDERELVPNLLPNRGFNYFSLSRYEDSDESDVSEQDSESDYPSSEQGSPLISIRYFLVDLASFESIREFAEQFKKDNDRLDILVNNAGVMSPPLKATKEGVDSTIGINYLGHFYLTVLLTDLLVSSNARLVLVSSDAHEGNNITQSDLEGDPLPSLFQPLAKDAKLDAQFKKYAASNRARIYFAKEFSKRYPDVTAVSLHPGMVNTGIDRDISGCWAGCFRCIFKFGKTPEEGAATSIYCATDANIERGQYYSSCRVKPLKKKWILEDVQEKLWEASKRICNEFETSGGI
eukprot:sb/3461660/